MLTCSVVLWKGRDTAKKYHWHVWGVLAVKGPHWVCHSLRQCVLPGPHCSGSRVPSQVDTSQVGLAFRALPWSKLLRLLGTP